MLHEFTLYAVQNDATPTCPTVVDSTTTTDTANEDNSTSTSASTSASTDTAANERKSSVQERFGPWNDEECKSLLKNLFDESKSFHSCFICKDAYCTGLSKETLSKFPGYKKFNHKWLNRSNWWLCFVETEGMYCLVCKKHHIKHPHNQREVFAATPSIRFKLDAITTHNKSSLHAAALQTEMIQKVSYFHQEVTKKSEVETSVLEGVFSTAYYLMKSFIANRQLLPLLNFIEKIFHVEDLKYFNHRSAECQSEIFMTLGETMKKSLLSDVKKSPAFGILTDEVCDISVTENLMTFIQYYNSTSESVCTQFLSCQNILSEFSSANADAITKLILSELKDDDLDVSKFAGFSSDGAAVMVGKRAGVATLLKAENPSLINVHCVCHRLALSCTDSNESINYIKTIETLLRQLWQLFENSPKKMAVYLKTQKQLKEISMGEKATKIVSKRLKKACRTRWLSLEASVRAVHGDYEAILHTLSILDQSGDAAATGLMKKMKSIKFLGTLYIMRDILPVLADLSKHFQKDSLNFSDIRPSINLAKDKLKKLLEEETPMQSLQTDIDSFSDMCAEIKLNNKELKELQSLFEKYVNALINNITRRFEDSSDVLAALGIFDPLSVPLQNQPGFKEYGIAQINILADHFHQLDEPETKTRKTEKMQSEWQSFKYHINDVLKPVIPEDVRDGSSKSTNTTEWLLLQLLRNPTFENFYPSLIPIAAAAVAIPITNAWPERGASSLKNIKTKLRNRLGEAMLENILHVCINGPAPESKEGQTIIKAAVDSWLKAKNRRKVAKVNKISGACGVVVKETLNDNVISQDASVQTEENPVIVEAQEVLSEVRQAMKVMAIENENDSDFEDESDFDDDCCW
ncbi:Hypothetical predicted protein [Mytilus galloprovincialis]|uniref:C17orf113 probable zinc finger domain-containing protein n=1 Tax=Mytilus galloprovincialis TaxID=29158 RepID=A0A8B6FYR3_MYTGA|nr:Hypothetical predicted protein [Mytilus galloprovincialis]